MKIISPSLLNSDTYQIKEQFEALEKCLSARNASCRRAAMPFFVESFCTYGIIASNILFEARAFLHIW